MVEPVVAPRSFRSEERTREASARRAPRLTRAERQQRTRTALLESAMTVFAERGIAGASVEEICARVGLTRGAFYAHFASKDEVCLALVEARSEKGIGLASGAIDAALAREDDSPAEVIAAIIAEVVSHIEVTPVESMFNQELSLYAQREPSFRPPYRAMLERFHASIAELVERGLMCRSMRLRVPLELFLDLIDATFTSTTQRALLAGATDGGKRLRRDALANIIAILIEPNPDAPTD